jgi:hypothetical protein
MSREFEGGEVLRSHGYLSMTAEQGVASLLYALRHDETQLLVGIDGTNKNIQKYFRPEAIAVETTVPVAGDDTYLAPRTGVEKQLAKIWQDVLGVPRVGLKDNFFELGGRSLLAAKMFAQVQKTLGKNLPIPALFKSPTIEQLSLVFLEQPKSNSVKIRTLQSTGTRPPLFLVPGAGMDGDGFKELAGQLGPDQPCFGLQARALASSVATGQPVSVGEIAGLFAGEIAVLFPTGPCALGGQSFGAVLAWETARVLTAQGRTVSLLALIDPPPAAFFASENTGKMPAYRFVKPAAGLGKVFGQFFKKSSGNDGGVTKDLCQARENYGDARLAMTDCPVALFTTNGSRQPWSELATRSFAVFSPAETGTRLAELIVQ